GGTGATAVQVADRSLAGAVYKGIEMARMNGDLTLFATDFHNGKIDMFDQDYNFIGNNLFNDPNLPAGFAPFNSRHIQNWLIVTYAKQLGPQNEDDEAGPGNGYVNVFGTDGSFIMRFASQGTLNSPWGIELMATGNGHGQLGDTQGENNRYLLIGNFGDG